MRSIIALGALVALLVLASTASAHRPHSHGGYLCTDNGTTLYFANIEKALKQFPDASPGKCVVVTPPPDETTPPDVTPPVIPDPIVLPSGPAGTFLCISHNDQTVPSFVDWGQVLNWLGEGDFVPMAVGVDGLISGQDVLQTPTGFYELVCGPHPGTGTGIGDGVGYEALAWSNVLSTYGSVHPNFYEIAG
jgi:hypothetical protein